MRWLDHVSRSISVADQRPDRAATNARQFSVIVPCFNEEANLGELVARTQKVFAETLIEGEIVLVDDASTDRTFEVIRTLAAQHSNVVAARHETNRGIVGAWRTGLALSSGPLVATIDADMQYAPEDIGRLYREGRRGEWDLVQGWRRDHEEPPIRGALRRVLSLVWSKILNLLFSLDLHDSKSGFVVYRREVFRDILSFHGNYSYFQHFITVSAHSKGYRITQIPVTFHVRRGGESFIKHPIWFALKAVADLPTAIREFGTDRTTSQGR